MPGRDPNTFASIAPRYDALRPLSAGDRTRLQRLVSTTPLGPQDIAVEVGCGTGRLTLPLAALVQARVIGVDAEPRMLAVARGKDSQQAVEWLPGTAYRLPLQSAEVSLVLMVMVVHLLRQRGRAFKEAHRVLRKGGKLSIWSFSHEHVRGFYLVPFFPSIERIDLERFPALPNLERELKAVGFSAPVVERQPDEGEVAISEVVDRVRGRYISTLSLLSPLEYRIGLQQLEEKLAQDPRGTLHYRHEWVVVTATR